MNLEELRQRIISNLKVGDCYLYEEEMDNYSLIYISKIIDITPTDIRIESSILPSSTQHFVDEGYSLNEHSRSIDFNDLNQLFTELVTETEFNLLDEKSKLEYNSRYKIINKKITQGQYKESMEVFDTAHRLINNALITSVNKINLITK